MRHHLAKYELLQRGLRNFPPLKDKAMSGTFILISAYSKWPKAPSGNQSGIKRSSPLSSVSPLPLPIPPTTMPFRYSAHRVGKCPELIDRIMRSYKPVSKFHHDPDHQRERKDQMHRGQCSDADALTRMARVCSSWFYCAMPLLWHDVSSKDLEVYLTTGRSLEVSACVEGYIVYPAHPM